MAELKNFAEIIFTNPILIDIFQNYIGNEELAGIVSGNGGFHMKFKVSADTQPPQGTEQILSLIYALLESNADTPAGKVFMENQKEILRETIYRLSEVLNGFTEVKLTIHVTETDANGQETFRETVTTLSRNSTTQNNN